MSDDELPGPISEGAHRRAFDWGSIHEGLGIAARLFFVVWTCAVVVASLFGAPRVLYSYHVSHFAVLYVLTLAALGAFPNWAVLNAFWRLVGLVTVLGVARVLVRHHVETSFLDWIADVSGILGGLAPVAVHRLREAQTSARHVPIP